MRTGHKRISTCGDRSKGSNTWDVFRRSETRLFVAHVLDGDATIDLRRQLGTSLKTDDNSVDRYKRRKKALQGQTQPCAHRGYREAVRLLHNRRSSLSLRRDLAGL